MNRGKKKGHRKKKSSFYFQFRVQIGANVVVVVVVAAASISGKWEQKILLRKCSPNDSIGFSKLFFFFNFWPTASPSRLRHSREKIIDEDRGRSQVGSGTEMFPPPFHTTAILQRLERKVGAEQREKNLLKRRRVFFLFCTCLLPEFATVSIFSVFVVVGGGGGKGGGWFP